MLKSKSVKLYANVVMVVFIFLMSLASPASAVEKNFDSSALYMAGCRAYEMKQYDQAVEYMEKFVQNCQDETLLEGANHVLGMSYKNLGSFERASEVLNAMIKNQNLYSSPRRVEWYFAMAEICEASNAYLPAAIWYLDISSQGFTGIGDLRAAEALYRAGEAFEKCGEKEKALGSYKRIISQYASSSIAKLVETKIAALSARAAENVSKNTREFNPTDSAAAAQYYNSALSYESTNKNTALMYYNSIMGLYPLTQYADMACERICALVGGQYPPGNSYSVADLTRCGLLFSKASAYERTGNVSMAINFYRAVISKYPNTGDAYSSQMRLKDLTGSCAK